ncbi:MAG: 16S rRNA (guanine(527)-N(7))-methyltransferase RsmG [Oscillospiraceae bacterium]|jgi:16S rRNA (guanine527-N7)-methyltransferase|nr:16S rRNA (guanine(527)-N(7))-methyltransferase RsmG [Oscillospiraceae bacterium]
MDGEQLDEKLAEYRDMLISANAVMNLTAITAPGDIDALHFRDSLALLPILDELAACGGQSSIIDIGSGAGFPGLPLALARPALAATLLDARERRVEFLQSVVSALGISNVTCIHARAEEYAAAKRESFDFAAARAVADLRELCELSLPLVRLGGYFLAMKGSAAQEELDAAQNAIETLGGKAHALYRYTIPGTEVTHSVAIIEKIRETPAEYPRRYKKIQTKPL